MRLPLCLMLLGVACGAGAQDRVVYDDALQNGFVDCYSYGGGTDLLHATTTRNGSLYSVAFAGNNSNAVAFAHENVDFTTTDYVGVRFYVHGGATGGQQLRFQLHNSLGGPPLANVELDTYIAGGAIAANEWRLVEVRFANAPLSFAGTFDRFDLQSDVPGTQSSLYLDDVALLAAAPLTPFIFSDSFEGSCPPGPAGNLRFTRAAFGVGEAAGSATVGVERVNGSFGPIAVTYATSDGTALQPGDYASANGLLSWAAGEVGTRSFAVAIVNDASVEPDETINLALSGATGGATLAAPSSAVLTIADDDRSFSIGDVALSEGNTGTTAFTFTVTRVGNLSGTDTVQAQSADGTAVAPGDYAPLAPTTLTFAPGATTQTATVNVNGDTVFEPDETFFVNLSNPSSGAITDAQGVGTVVNDDAAPACGDNTIDAGEVCFDAVVTTGALNGPRGIVGGDFNGDTRVDVAIANDGNDTVVVLLNSSSAPGTFTASPATNIPAGAAPRGIAAADVDGDGDLDLATANNGADSVTVLFNSNTAPGTFPTQVTFSLTGGGGGSGTVNPRALVFADFNGVVGIDLAVANNGDDTVSVLFNNGVGLFGNERVVAVGLGPAGIAAANVDGDGDNDLAATNDGGGTITVLYNSNMTPGTFPVQATFAAGAGPLGIIAVNVDTDADLDLVCANAPANTVGVLLNNGSGQFGTLVAFTVGTLPQSVAAGNFNMSTLLDLAVANTTSNTVSVLVNNGSGLFATEATLSTGAGSAPGGIVVADFNGDTVPDIVTSNRGTDQIGVLLSNP